MKTQASLEEITQILATLDQASGSLQSSIHQVQDASAHQKEIANQLLATSNQVKTQSQQAVEAAHQAHTFVQQQDVQVNGFIQMMDAMQHQVEQATALASRIQADMQHQSGRITNTLNSQG